jgi:protein-tyrosine phosphatase
LSGNAKRQRLALTYSLGAVATLALAVWMGGIALWLAWLAAALAAVALNYLLLGTRGFAKHHSGQVGWAAQWMLAPYRLGAWLNSRWWTRKSPQALEVVPGAWLGRLPGARDHEYARWTSAVDLTAEFAAARRVPTIAVPMLDLVAPQPAQLRRAAHAIDWQYRRHGSVLVHCALGYSRSAAALAAWLVMYEHAASIPEAAALIRRVRPEIVLDENYFAALAAAVQPDFVASNTAIARLAQLARA